MPTPFTFSFQKPVVRRVKPAPQRLEAPPGLYCPAKILAQETGPAHRTYCGPWALMALTGRSYPEVRATINRVRGKRPNAPVVGLRVVAMLATLDAFGFKHKTQCRADKISLARLLSDRTPEEVNETWLIVASNHYVLVRGRKVTCAMLRCWTWIRDAKKRRGVVKYVIRVS